MTTPTYTLTEFPHAKSTRGRIVKACPDDLPVMLQREFKRKQEQPLIDFAIYPSNSRARGSLPTHYHGVILDFDHEIRDIDEIAAVMRDIGCTAWLHETWSHSSQGPRVHALVPFSTEIPLEKRQAICWNLIMVTNAAPESQDAKRSFFIGRPKGRARQHRHVAGICADLLPALRIPQSGEVRRLPGHGPCRGRSTRTPGGDTVERSLRVGRWGFYSGDIEEGDGPRGGRNNQLASWAGLIREDGATVEELHTVLQALNAEFCKPPLGDQEVRGVASSIGRYDAGISAQVVCKQAMDSVRAKFGKPADIKVSKQAKRKLVEGTLAVTVTPVDGPCPTPEWGEPYDFFAHTTPPTLQADMLPAVIHEWANAQASLLGVDTGSIAMAALTTCAGLLTDRLKLQPVGADPKWLESARLWYAVVGDPSVKKTPMLRKATAVAWSINADLLEKYRHALGRWHEEAAVAKRDSKPVPEKPPCRRAVVDDFTIEALSEILKNNAQGVLQIKNELADFFADMVRYSTGKGAGDTSLYLSLYDGGERSIDRIQRGELFVPNWSVSLIGGIQPATMREIIGKMRHDGLLQRFLVTQSCSRSPVERAVSVSIEAAYERICLSLVDVDRSISGKRLVVQLGPDADVVRRRAFSRLDSLAAALVANTRLSSHLGKWPGVFARLALTMHAIEVVARTHQPRFEGKDLWVSERTALMVERLLFDYLLPHLLAFYESVLDDEAAGGMDRGLAFADASKVAEHILAKRIEEFTPGSLTSQIARWRYRRPREKEDVLTLLEELNWISPAETEKEKERRAGRPAGSRWLVNPLVHQKFVEQGQQAARAMADLAKVFAGLQVPSSKSFTKASNVGKRGS